MTDQDFEERLSALLTGGSDRPLAADTIIAGARRRRTRRRTAAAASSLALLGMAAGVVVLDGRVPGRTTGVGPGTATATPSLATPTPAPLTTDTTADGPSPEPHRQGTPDEVLALLAPGTTVGTGTITGHRWQVIAAKVPDEAAFDAAHPDLFLDPAHAAVHKPAVWGFLLIDGDIRTAFETPASATSSPPYAYIPAFALQSGGGKSIGDFAYGYVDPRVDHYRVDYATGAPQTVKAIAFGAGRMAALADSLGNPAVKVTAYDAEGNVLDSKAGATLTH